jgi:hypothetical protein
MPVTLEDARILPGLDLRASFQVNYRFEGQGPEPGKQYLWVVRSSRRPIFQRRLSAAELGRSRTLRWVALFRPSPFEGSLETFLAVERSVPGQAAGQYERISNIEPVKDAVPNGVRPGMLFPWPPAAGGRGPRGNLWK